LTAAFALLAGAAIVAGACSGAPAKPALTDPTEIITEALKATEGAKSFHLEATLDGSINMDLTGQGGEAPAMALTDTTATGDVDIAGQKVRLAFAVPAFLGLTGELIQVGTTSYMKTSLGGALYEKQEQSDATPDASAEPIDMSAAIKDVTDFLATDGVDPVKGADVDCGGKQCYTVTIELTAEELAALGTEDLPTDELPVDLASASMTMTVRVEKDTYRPAGFNLAVSLGEQGSLTFDLSLSKWDESVTISAPPDDQVKPAA
jgi:hypothetical protein